MYTTSMCWVVWSLYVSLSSTPNPSPPPTTNPYTTDTLNFSPPHPTLNPSSTSTPNPSCPSRHNFSYPSTYNHCPPSAPNPAFHLCFSQCLKRHWLVPYLCNRTSRVNKIILHAGNTLNFGMCVIQILYHECESILWVFQIPCVHVYTMSLCLYPDSMSIP